MDDKTINVTVVEVNPQIVLGTQRKGAYKEIAALIPEVCGYAAKNNITIAGPPIFVCHETSFEEAMEADKNNSAIVEIAVPISEKVADSGEIKCYELPGGKMAKITHNGPYEQCGPTYEKLYAWLGENGKKIVGPTREVYMNDPREVAPEEIITDIYAPIE